MPVVGLFELHGKASKLNTTPGFESMLYQHFALFGSSKVEWSLDAQPGLIRRASWSLVAYSSIASHNCMILFRKAVHCILGRHLLILSRPPLPSSRAVSTVQQYGGAGARRN
jgi:hypothetical protein